MGEESAVVENKQLQDSFSMVVGARKQRLKTFYSEHSIESNVLFDGLFLTS